MVKSQSIKVKIRDNLIKRGHPLKGTSQGKKVPRCNEISVSLPSKINWSSPVLSHYEIVGIVSLLTSSIFFD
jgi:hypothetical protein